jgi:hypothetical protein
MWCSDVREQLRSDNPDKRTGKMSEVLGGCESTRKGAVVRWCGIQYPQGVPLITKNVMKVGHQNRKLTKTVSCYHAGMAHGIIRQ